MCGSIFRFTTPPGNPRAFTKKFVPTPGTSFCHGVKSRGYDPFCTFLCLNTTDFSHFPVPTPGISLEIWSRPPGFHGEIAFHPRAARGGVVNHTIEPHIIYLKKLAEKGARNQKLDINREKNEVSPQYLPNYTSNHPKPWLILKNRLDSIIGIKNYTLEGDFERLRT